MLGMGQRISTMPSILNLRTDATTDPARLATDPAQLQAHQTRFRRSLMLVSTIYNKK